MHRIDTSTAVAAMPTPAAAGTAGYFQEGNPLTGTAGTFISADWLNTVMMELVNILTAAGITPNKSVQNQVLASLNVLYGGSGTNTGNFGERTLPGGTRIKWGVGTTASNGVITVDFSNNGLTDFPTTIVNVQATHSSGAVGSLAFGVSGINQSGFNVYASQAAAGAFYWFAVGY